jgi:hypothetical protein
VSDAPVAFFSYSREDSEFALRLASDLRAAGSSVWIDQLDIGPGQLWDRAVQTALERCPSVLIILSPASVNSDNVMDEVSFALDQKKELIPVLYRDCDIPFRVRRFQHLDFRSNYEPMLEELKKCLHIAGKSEAALATTSTASAPSAPPGNCRADSADPQIPYPAPPVEQRRPAEHEIASPYSVGTSAGAARSKFPIWAKVGIPVVAVLIAVLVAMKLGTESALQSQSAGRGSPDAAAASGNHPAGSPGAAEIMGAGLMLRQGQHKCTAPEKTQTDFSVSDPAVELVFGFRNGNLSDDWTVNWIGPNGQTYDAQSVKNTDAGHGRYCYFIYISGHKPAEMPGEWAVSLNRDGQEMARLPFRITR